MGNLSGIMGDKAAWKMIYRETEVGEMGHFHCFHVLLSVILCMGQGTDSVIPPLLFVLVIVRYDNFVTKDKIKIF